MGTIARMERQGLYRIAWALPALRPLLAASAYFVAAKAAFAVGTLTQQFAPFWPPNVAVAALSALAIDRLMRGPPWLDSLRNALLYLLFTVLLIPGVVALFAGLEPLLGDGDPRDYGQFWWRWYLSNALGSLTLAPIFLAWFPAA